MPDSNLPDVPAPSDDDGAVFRFIRWAFGRSWQTSLAGIGPALAAIAIAVDQAELSTDPRVHKVAMFAVALGFGSTAAGLRLAKSVTVTGTK